ncbi:beta-glucosidase [Nocardioides gansuensis]|uniref:Beta-glucosidase n=1 Tax=Nocardioides gansuensis TaxID=2138300 RepID=A0A2T8FFR8_9ACTN|nr:GH1 family beta-glucosidase [Nocardioides gansuensis]PVG84554.1 beta-glucosidase [Nocardioides gansuensis]
MTSPVTTTAPTSSPSEDHTFPSGFLWGASTAAYQIEGATDEDGRTPSIWDTFSRVPGAVVNGDTGDVACDHYHRMPEDVALMKSLHLNAYRFSVAWPRVRPDAGSLNPKGIDFYKRLVDELLAHEITPWLTLYHWDLPQVLEDAGGWTSRDTAYRFADYALSLHDELGDRVPFWTTMNEPWCSAFLGYTGGQHAPGRQEGVAGLVAAHHLMLGHGLVVDELRRRGTTADLGITLNFTVVDPIDPDDERDRDAARRIDGLFNRVFLEPIFRGHYADDLLADTGHLTWRGRPWQEVVQDGDLDLISTPLDVLGVNYYHPDAVSGHPHDDVLGSAIEHAPRPVRTPFVGCEDVTMPRRGLPVTAMDWEVQPEALTRLLVRLHTDYGVPPMYITENGAAYDDTVGDDGRVHDPDRVDYYDGHLRAAHAAMEAGVDMRGYFAWSLMDNFEWAYGYSKRFGLVHVDYETQARTPKTSALFLADVASTGRLGPVGP